MEVVVEVVVVAVMVAVAGVLPRGSDGRTRPRAPHRDKEPKHSPLQLVSAVPPDVRTTAAQLAGESLRVRGAGGGVPGAAVVKVAVQTQERARQRGTPWCRWQLRTRYEALCRWRCYVHRDAATLPPPSRWRRVYRINTNGLSRHAPHTYIHTYVLPMYSPRVSVVRCRGHTKWLWCVGVLRFGCRRVTSHPDRPSPPHSPWPGPSFTQPGNLVG